MYLEDKSLIRHKQQMCRRIGNLFRKAREDCGLTPEQVATMCRYTVYKINRLENGEFKYKSINLGLLTKLATCYGRRLEMKLKPNEKPKSAG